MCLHSCHTTIPTDKEPIAFDIPKFINSEIEILQTLNPTITKTVSNGKSKEVKQLKIANWQKELSQFALIDLNKSGSFNFLKERYGDTLVFKTPPTVDNTIVIKVIYSHHDTPIQLYISKKTQNLLYVNEEKLHYTVGKAYSIDKRQYVRGIGDNHYLVSGKIE